MQAMGPRSAVRALCSVAHCVAAGGKVADGGNSCDGAWLQFTTQTVDEAACLARIRAKFDAVTSSAGVIWLDQENGVFADEFFEDAAPRCPTFGGGHSLCNFSLS